MAAKPEPKPQAESAEAPTAKSKSKLLVIIAAVCVLLGGGGAAGAWYFMNPAEPAEAKPKPPVFLPLEAFTVNLLPTNGQTQYIQAGLTLKLEDDQTAALLKQRMPELRNRILLMLSSQNAGELIPATGKQKLAEDLALAVKALIEVPPPVRKKSSEEDAEKDKAAEGDQEDPNAARKPKDARKVEVLFTSIIIQ